VCVGGGCVLGSSDEREEEGRRRRRRRRGVGMGIVLKYCVLCVVDLALLPCFVLLCGNGKSKSNNGDLFFCYSADEARW
jgi:hypothetical protein